jgi:hypothetical protein
MRFLKASLMLLFMTWCLGPLAHANQVLFLDFNTLGNLQPVGNFYNGGSTAPNVGVMFSSNFYGLKPISQGGGGNFSPDPTHTAAIFINGTTGSPVTGTMTVSSGFSSGINFFYTAAFQETVTVWSGPNGTGTVLATIALSPNDGACGGSYCNWTDVGLSFSGTAGSVTFSGGANGLGLADITIGQSTTVLPEPSSFYLLGTGVAGLWGYWARRARI